MDLEGAELNALAGAEKTIRAYRPRLAISIYHRPKDVSTIPRIIRDIEPGYRFYLDHYYPNNWETVLYCSV